MKHFEIQLFWLKAKNTVAQRNTLGWEKCGKFSENFSAGERRRRSMLITPCKRSAARGRECSIIPHNPVGVEHQPVPSCAPTERGTHHVVSMYPELRLRLARGYHGFASYGGARSRAALGTAALGYCLYRFALSERRGLGKSKKLCDYKELMFFCGEKLIIN